MRYNPRTPNFHRLIHPPQGADAAAQAVTKRSSLYRNTTGSTLRKTGSRLRLSPKMTTQQNTRRGSRKNNDVSGPSRPAAPVASVGFDELGLEEWLLRSVASLDLGAPTQLQAEMIPAALRGDDCLVGASAGAGKTAAYGLPLLQRVEPDRGLQAMVVVPTKELAARVHSRIRRMSGEREFQVIAAFPARDRRGFENEAPTSTDGEILIGTPGRILDLIERGAIDLNSLRLLVIEEFDRILAMDLLERVQRIAQNLSPDRQTIVLVDRLDADVREAALPLLREPREIRMTESEKTNPLEYRAIDIGDSGRLPALLGFLEAERPRRVLIIAASDHESRSTVHSLRDAGYRTETLGERPQRRDFGRDQRRPRRSGNASVHVDSRLPSRGADLANLSHVVFLHAPYDAPDFAHQMNRLGRLMNQGVIVLFAADEELEAFTALETAVGASLKPTTPDWVHGPTGDGPPMDDDGELDDRGSRGQERGGDDDSQGNERDERPSRGGERGGRDRGRGGRDGDRRGRGGDGERRGRGGGGGRSRGGGSRSETKAPAAPASNRFAESLRRDAELEARGIMPIPRTLGSRFKPAGRSRKSK